MLVQPLLYQYFAITNATTICTTLLVYYVGVYYEYACDSLAMLIIHINVRYKYGNAPNGAMSALSAQNSNTSAQISMQFVLWKNFCKIAEKISTINA